MNREQALFEPFIIDLNPNIVFEFGSYDLTDGLYYRKLWPNASINCFEPNPELYKTILPLARKNDIFLLNYAFSSRDGIMDFYPSVKLDGVPGPSGSLLKQTDGHIESQKFFQTFPSLIKVTCRSIESFCKEYDITTIDFMHIDVEGVVPDVLDGFGKIRPKIIRAEVHDRDSLFHGAYPARFIHAYIAKMGYKILFNSPNRSADTLYQYDGNNS